MNKTGFYLLVVAHATSALSSGILTPIYAFFVQKIGGGILETSCAIALYSIISGVVTLLIFRTKWSHTYQLECLYIGWLIWLLSVCMYFCISTFSMLFLSQVLNGLGNALSASSYDAEYSRQTLDNLSGGWSIWEGLTGIIAGIAALLGGFVTVHYGFGVLIWFMVAAAITSFFLILYYVYREKNIAKNKGG